MEPRVRLKELGALKSQRGLSEAEWEEVALLYAQLGRQFEAAKALGKCHQLRRQREGTKQTAQPAASPAAEHDRVADGSPGAAAPKPASPWGEVKPWHKWLLAIGVVAFAYSMLYEQMDQAQHPANPPTVAQHTAPTETPAAAAPQAVVVSARLTPYTTAGGAAAQMILVDWRNAGSVPIRAVFADIVPYDASGNRLSNGAPDYCIYAASESSPGIAPGNTYDEPDGEGFVLFSLPGDQPSVARCEVRITRASEH